MRLFLNYGRGAIDVAAADAHGVRRRAIGECRLSFDGPIGQGPLLGTPHDGTFYGVTYQSGSGDGVNDNHVDYSRRTLRSDREPLDG